MKIYYKFNNGKCTAFVAETVSENFNVTDYLVADSEEEFESITGLSLNHLNIPYANKKRQIQKLWESCKKHQYVDDAAIRLFDKAGTTKAAANLAWIESLWEEYYVRKATVDGVNEPDYDFSSIGEMPHSIEEALEAE